MHRLVVLLFILMFSAVSQASVAKQGKNVSPPKPPPGWRVSQPVITPPVFVPITGGNVAFTPLHKYFMSATGSDSNNGTSPATPWLTPNHSVVCGDVIIALSSASYTDNNFGGWGTVSNCPSTSGGIDSMGGIYFATIVCGGSDLEACKVSNSGGTGAVFGFNANYWAVEGFKVSGGSTNGDGKDCFLPQAQNSGTQQYSYIAIINSICYNANGTFAVADGGLNHNVPGNGADYLAVVGVIAQNANQEPICSGSIVGVGLSPIDNNAGTHVYFYNNYVMANQQAAVAFSGYISGTTLTVTTFPAQTNRLGLNTNAIQEASGSGITSGTSITGFGSGSGQTGTYTVSNSQTVGSSGSPVSMVGGVCMENMAGGIDGENMMLDTPDAHGFTGQVVFDNNIAYLSARFGFNFFYQGFHSENMPLQITHNTLFANNSANKGDSGGGTSGDINVQSSVSGGAGAIPWVVTITNNISKTHWSAAGGISGQPTLYALQMGSPVTTSTIGGTGNENIFKGQAGNCSQPTSCDSGNNVDSYNGASFGTNTYTDPLFTNETDLLTNQIGTPTCPVFITTTACMGWAATTRTLTTPSVISDLQASCAGCSGKGFQLPSTVCAANAQYPAWLKGIVPLWYDGANLWERPDLITRPCNL